MTKVLINSCSFSIFHSQECHWANQIYVLISDEKTSWYLYQGTYVPKNASYQLVEGNSDLVITAWISCNVTPMATFNQEYSRLPYLFHFQKYLYKIEFCSENNSSTTLETLGIYVKNKQFQQKFNFKFLSTAHLIGCLGSVITNCW